MLFPGNMYSNHADPHEILQPQTNGTGVDLWDLFRDFTTGPTSKECGIFNDATVTHKEHLYVDPTSVLGNATPACHHQTTRSLSELGSVDSQFLPLYNAPFPLELNMYPGVGSLRRPQVSSPQPTQGLIVPNFDDTKAKGVIYNNKIAQFPEIGDARFHTIGYVCDEEDKEYVFKCGDLGCSDKSFGRWTDLKRHYEGAHAVARRATFWCAVQGCDRSEAFGDRPFPRKDKLADHLDLRKNRLVARSSRVLLSAQRTQCRAFSFSTIRSNEFEALNKRTNDTSEKYRNFQKSKPLNPHMTNTTSTIANEMPSVGTDAPPPELITNVDPNFQPKDGVPENTERMTGGTQGSKGKDVSGSNSELGVGEMEGAKFKVEPIRRTGEDANTMRARLLYQSRKRGTLESDLLLSTFADAHLSTMSAPLLEQYDLFLDENDWDIYYWATQEPTPTSHETAEGGGSMMSTPNAQGKESKTGTKVQEKDERTREPATGEWAQTVGTFKPAYRPVPSRWKGSEILSMLRRHVNERKAGGVIEGEGSEKKEGKGLGMMPEIKNFDQ
ncbi:DUF339-domain-containing protein [Plenodomus tracheiphilus IPT5]|uniref:Succinate dehydrogenase assembly factor 2, mitochondrial n=1 Tax=Plenodomus tracheiphilus IPT5 TaxID=1408161 RepID=A0A6A7BF24_9PLEO|nr:DUF339-domain-containing protein [Plenodomus tracheiphilus IPT5]